MAATPALIRELRELTGSGMSDCKKALEETGGDIKKAVEFLREKGLAAAAKKSGRIAAEGVVAIHVAADMKKAAMVEVNCETDFVAINAQFKGYCQEVVDQVLASPAETVEAFMEEAWAADASQGSVADALKGKIATIGENINIRRFAKFERTKPGIYSSYIHGGGKIGVIMDIECENASPAVAEMGYNLCMQIAAMFPKYLRREEVDADFIETEKRILTQAAKNDPANAAKPENVIEKMIEGRLSKQLQEICLLEQAYVREPSMTVKQYVENTAKEAGCAIHLAKFTCYEKGEGIEKKQEDFAAEVAQAMQG